MLKEKKTIFILSVQTLETGHVEFVKDIKHKITHEGYKILSQPPYKAILNFDTEL